MRHYYKQCKNLKEVDKYIKSLHIEGTEDWDFTDAKSIFYGGKEYDEDMWMDAAKTKGVSVQITTDFQVSVNTYTNKDHERWERDLNKPIKKLKIK